MVLPGRMPEAADQTSLNDLCDYLKETYATRSRRYATIVEVGAVREGEAFQERFRVVQVGPRRDLLPEVEVRSAFLSPIPASPVRDQVAAECVEFLRFD